MTARGRWVRSVALLVGALVLVGACSDDDTISVADAPTSTEPAGGDELAVLLVGEAVALVDGTHAAVRGYVFGQHGETDAYVLCGSIAESFPPQCGGDRLYVVDPQALVAQLDHAGTVLERDGDVSWSDGEVIVTGRREGPDGLAATMPVAGSASGAGASTGSGGVVSVEVGESDSSGVVAEALVVDDALEVYTIVPHRAVLVAPDVLELHLWGGTHPCWALQSVELIEEADTVTLHLLAGVPPEGVDAVCDTVAVEVTHTVPLSADLDGRMVMAVS